LSQAIDGTGNDSLTKDENGAWGKKLGNIVLIETISYDSFQQRHALSNFWRALSILIVLTSLKLNIVAPHDKHYVRTDERCTSTRGMMLKTTM